MPNYTTNLKLKKPLKNENYNIDDANGNCDIIETFYDDFTNAKNELTTFKNTKGQPNGIASLDTAGKVPLNQLPAIESGSKIASGTYTGNAEPGGGSNPRIIQTGFRPYCLMISRHYKIGSTDSGEKQISIFDGNETWDIMGQNSNYLQIVENGFKIGIDSVRPDALNKTGQIFSYIAIGK